MIRLKAKISLMVYDGSEAEDLGDPITVFNADAVHAVADVQWAQAASQAGLILGALSEMVQAVAHGVPAAAETIAEKIADARLRGRTVHRRIGWWWVQVLVPPEPKSGIYYSDDVSALISSFDNPVSVAQVPDVFGEAVPKQLVGKLLGAGEQGDLQAMWHRQDLLESAETLLWTMSLGNRECAFVDAVCADHAVHRAVHQLGIIVDQAPEIGVMLAPAGFSDVIPIEYRNQRLSEARFQQLVALLGMQVVAPTSRTVH
jgi:hypothetical protein